MVLPSTKVKKVELVTIPDREGGGWFNGGGGAFTIGKVTDEGKDGVGSKAGPR